jgi:hypothetical protein
LACNVIDPEQQLPACKEKYRPAGGLISIGKTLCFILTSFEKMHATENSAEAAWNQ